MYLPQVQQHVRLLLARPTSHAAMLRYLTEKGPRPYRCPYSPHSMQVLARMCGVSEAEVHRQLQPPLIRLLIQRLYIVYMQMQSACPHRNNNDLREDVEETSATRGNNEDQSGERLWQGVVLSRMQVHFFGCRIASIEL